MQPISRVVCISTNKKYIFDNKVVCTAFQYSKDMTFLSYTSSGSLHYESTLSIAQVAMLLDLSRLEFVRLKVLINFFCIFKLQVFISVSLLWFYRLSFLQYCLFNGGYRLIRIAIVNICSISLNLISSSCTHKNANLII